MKIRQSMLLVAFAALLGGCAEKQSASSEPVGGKSSMEAAGHKASSESAYYAEESADGRIYVFGTAKLHEAYKASKQKPHIAKSFIGSGPSGETVVLEADAKSNDLQERLRQEFNRRHGTNL
jgi:hypothetical protein